MAGTFLSSLLSHSKFSSRYQQTGFTLLELLIVIFIISLISAGFIKLSVGFGNATQSLENETKRLNRLLSLTAQEAILQGSEIGLLIEADGYHFVSHGQEVEWVTFDGDDMLQRHQLPQGWRLELNQFDQVIPPAAVIKIDETEKKDGVKKEVEQLEPAIVFYASGEIAPFQLHIFAVDNPDPSTIEAKENGEIEMHFQNSNR